MCGGWEDLGKGRFRLTAGWQCESAMPALQGSRCAVPMGPGCPWVPALLFDEMVPFN